MVRRNDICVVSHDATYGNAPELAKALGAKLTLFAEDPKGMYKNYPYEKFVQPADEYILVGAFVIRDLDLKLLKDKKVKIILVGTAYRRGYHGWNRFFHEKGWEVFAMPDLADKAKTDKIYYHPYDLSSFYGQKHDRLTVCHSPGTPLKFKDKDTLFISGVVKSLDVDYKMLMGLSQEEAIRERAKCHIHVDQLKYSYGKSALEAMLTKTLVISGNILPDIPIEWVTKETLRDKLKFLIRRPEEIGYRAYEQYKWAKEHCSYEAVRENLCS